MWWDLHQRNRNEGSGLEGARDGEREVELNYRTWSMLFKWKNLFCAFKMFGGLVCHFENMGVFHALQIAVDKTPKNYHKLQIKWIPNKNLVLMWYEWQMIANNFSNLYINQMNCILQLTVTLGEFWITFKNHLYRRYSIKMRARGGGEIYLYLYLYLYLYISFLLILYPIIYIHK